MAAGGFPEAGGNSFPIFAKLRQQLFRRCGFRARESRIFPEDLSGDMGGAQYLWFHHL